MYSCMLKAKIHHARITESVRDYEGSLKIDLNLMEAVRIAPYEKILVANVENGNRFETYAIPGERGSGVIGLNGAAVYQGSIGDRVIIFTFCHVPTDQIHLHRPMILIVDEKNRPVGGLKEV